MFTPQPLRLWCMAAMAPALTEAATQVRAKLPTVGQTNGRFSGRDSPSSAPDSTDPLAPSRTTLGTPGLSTAGAAGKPPPPPLQPQSHLLTLSTTTTKQPDISSSYTIARLNPVNFKEKSATSAHSFLVKGVGKLAGPPPALSTTTSGGTTHLGLLTADHHLPKSAATTTTTVLGHLNRASDRPSTTTVAGRMNQPKITLPSPATTTTDNPTTTTTKNTLSGGVVKMPHTAAAPNLQANKNTTNMGYTFKTNSQTGSSQTSPTNSLRQSGGVVGPSGSDINLTAQQHPEMEADGVSLQALEDIASVTQVDVLSTSSTGMADVGLLNNVDRLAETAKRQGDLERQADRLLRRIRRIQSRQTIVHVQQQLSGFVDHQHKNLQTIAKAMKPQPSNNVDLKTELLQSEDVKSLSTAALVSLVRRLQTSQAMTLRQRLANANQSSSESGTSVLRLDEDLCTEMNRVSSTLQKDLKHLESAMDSDATESSSGGESCDEDFDYDEEKMPKTYLRRRAEWKWATERAAVAAKWTWLQAQVSDLEYRIRQQSDIYRQIRAAKGAVVLGEAVPPEDIMAKLRNNRTGRRLSPLEEKIASLERKNEMSPCNLSTLLSNVDKQSTRLTQQLGNVLSPAESPLLSNSKPQSAPSTPPKTPNTPNGYLNPASSRCDSGTTPSASTSVASAEDSVSKNKRLRTDGPLSLSFDPPSPTADNTCQSARCRPVKSYGKRKLLSTSGLYQLSRKAARLSTVPCYCYPPAVPCAMCGGRYNNMQTVNPVSMPTGERIALLDPSYHQVLSFPQDTHLPIHFDKLLRSGEWQHKPLPTKPLRALTGGKGKQKLPAGERKYKKLSKNSAVILSSAKIRNKYDMKQISRNNGSMPSSPNKTVPSQPRSSGQHKHTTETKTKKRKSSLSSISVQDGSRKKRTLSNPIPVSSQPVISPSPTSASPRDTPSPLSHSCSSSTLRDLKEAQRRRRGESAFDINNIVIPYSMAASTRVEKLLYKEIITPKWREIANDEKTNNADLAAASLPTPKNTPEQRPESENEIIPISMETEQRNNGPSQNVDGPSHTSNGPIQNSNELPQNTNELPQNTNELQQNTNELLQKTNGLPENTNGAPQNADGSLQNTNAPLQNTNAPLQNTNTPLQNTNGPLQITKGPLQNTNDPVEKTEPSEAKEEIKVPPSEVSPHISGGNGLIKSGKMETPTEEEDDSPIEDLSDELYATRHMRCEIREKKRYTSVIKKKSRGGRSDSVGPQEDDAPESTSQLPSTPPGTPATPVTPAQPATIPTLPAAAPQLTALIDEEMELSGGRRRSGSCSSHEDSSLGLRRRSLSGRLRSRVLSSNALNMEDQEEDSGVDPWILRTFPLCDEDYGNLFKENPVGPSSTATVTRGMSATTRGGYTYNTTTPENSNPTSPIPSSSNSSVIDDDPNDPEWTVIDGAEKPVQQPGLVLKLAKR